MSIELNTTPPTEFRIFTAGEVETTKGTFTFDDAAAKSVMDTYVAHGIDLMIDYDHASLAGLSLDPAESGKAAGWFNLELRSGELWAVNVRWTPPAQEALQNKEWRFMSPAFCTTEDGRIVDLLNVAITNMPATRGLTPLVAASIGKDMNPDDVKKALDALETGDEAGALEILKSMIATAASGDQPPADAAPPSSDAPPAEMSDAPPPPAAGDKKDPAAPASDDKEEDKKGAAVAASKLLRLSGKSSIVDALAEVAIWKASHLELETERKTLAAEKATLESAERRKGCADLVKAGRAPSTVWSDDKCSAPKAYLASMPIADFRDYVTDTQKAGGKSIAKQPTSTIDASGLTKRELDKCKKLGVDPVKYARTKASMNNGKG